MEKMVFTALTREELHALIIDSVNACLRHHAAQRPPRQEDQPAEAGQFISKRAAARLLDCCTSTVDNFARAGRLKRHYIGRSVRFSRAQVLGLADGKQSKTHGTKK